MHRRAVLGFRFLSLAVALFLVLAWLLPAGSGAATAAPSGSGVISGRVVNMAGKGIKGVKVSATAFDIPGAALEPLKWTATTDSSGSFSIRGLPDGNYMVEATIGRVGQRWQNVRLGGSKGKRVVLSFTLDQSTARGGVAGKIAVDPGRQTRVTFFPQRPGEYFSEWWVVPDSKGQFRIGLPAKTYTLMAEARSGDGTALYHRRSITVSSKRTAQVNIPLKSASPGYAEVRGRLATTKSSIRVMSITVHQITKKQLSWTEWGINFGVKSGKSYRIANLPPGQFLVTVELTDTSKRFAWYRYFRRVTLAKGQSLQLNFDRLAAPATVRGQVVDEKGNSVPSAEVVAYAKTADYLIGWGRAADEKGQFEIYLSEGTHRLRFYTPSPSDGRVRFKEVSVTVKAGQVVNLGTVRITTGGGSKSKK